MKVTKLLPVLFLAIPCILFATPCPEDLIKAEKNPNYFHHVILSGTVRCMVFPGPPNFVSIEKGDWEEPRTILEVDGDSLLRLAGAQSNVASNDYMGEFVDPTSRADEPNANLVTLDSSFSGELDHIERYENKRVTIDAVISAQPAHCHTPFVVEIAEILSHE